MKTNDLITRFLDGLTSPDEERQLRATLEAKTTLTADERAALDLLCLSFPEEDTAALLAEDVSQSTNHHSQFFFRRLVVVSGIAAAVILTFILWPESHEETTIQQDVKFVIAEATSQPVPQPIIEEKEEGHVAEVRPVPQPVRKHRKAVRKQQVEPAEIIISAETVEECAMAMEPIFNSYEDIEAEMLDIRSRGECVEAMVADLTRSF